MGSWNGTCGITRLPILSGEPIIALLIAEAGYGNKREAGYHCYVNDLFCPIVLPFKGTYNDYGSITDISETPLIEISLRSFGPAKESFEEWIYNHVTEGTVFIKEDDKDKKRAVGLWMCRQDILDIVYKNGGVYKNYEKVDGTYKHVKENMIERVKRDFNDLYNKILENKNLLAYYYEDKTPDPENKEEMSIASAARFKYTYNIEFGDRDNAANYILGISGFAGNAILQTHRFEIYREYLKYLVYKDYGIDSQEVEEVREAVVSFYLINNLMISNRISLAPQCGAGSQQDELGMYRKMNAAMTKAMYNIKHKWD